MSTVAAHKPTHSRNDSAHAPAFKKRAPNASNIEKWDVVMWNDEVHSSRELAQHDHHSNPLSSRSPPSSDTIPRSFTSISPNDIPEGPSRPLASLPGPNTLALACSASAFGFTTAHVKPRAVPQPIPSRSPVAESPQNRIDALASLHRSVQEQDVAFLARMRELEERCHLLPDSLSVLRSDDLTHSRGRKRSCVWDEDGDAEMSLWNECRRKHFAARSYSHSSLNSSPVLENVHEQKGYGTSGSGSEDEYVMPDEGDDSHSSEDEDEDIIIVGGSSAPSLNSTPPSLSTSLSSLPAHSDGRSPNLRNHASLPAALGTKDVDELSMAMAGGAGSVVDWCTFTSADAHDGPEAGALWA